MKQMKKEKRKEGRANDASLARGLNAVTFPPKRNLKVGKPLLRVAATTLTAVNETSCAILTLSIFHRVAVRTPVPPRLASYPSPQHTTHFSAISPSSSWILTLFAFSSSRFGDIDTDFLTKSRRLPHFLYHLPLRYQRPFCRACSARYSFVASVLFDVRGSVGIKTCRLIASLKARP